MKDAGDLRHGQRVVIDGHCADEHGHVHGREGKVVGDNCVSPDGKKVLVRLEGEKDLVAVPVSAVRPCKERR